MKKLAFLMLLGVGVFSAEAQNVNPAHDADQLKNVEDIFDTNGIDDELSAENDELAGSLVVYPNPSNGIVNLSVEGLSPSSEPVVHVYSMTGQLVHQSAINVNVRSTIDLSFLPKGTYIINVDAKLGTYAPQKAYLSIT